MVFHGILFVKLEMHGQMCEHKVGGKLAELKG